MAIVLPSSSVSHDNLRCLRTHGPLRIAAGNVTKSVRNSLKPSAKPPSENWSAILRFIPSVRFWASCNTEKRISCATTSLSCAISAGVGACPICSINPVTFSPSIWFTISSRASGRSGSGVGLISQGGVPVSIRISRNQLSAARHLTSVIIMYISEPPCCWIAAILVGSYSPLR